MGGTDVSSFARKRGFGFMNRFGALMDWFHPLSVNAMDTER
jgi:hypothetical protein